MVVSYLHDDKWLGIVDRSIGAIVVVESEVKTAAIGSQFGSQEERRELPVVSLQKWNGGHPIRVRLLLTERKYLS